MKFSLSKFQLNNTDAQRTQTAVGTPIGVDRSDVQPDNGEIGLIAVTPNPPYPTVAQEGPDKIGIVRNPGLLEIFEPGTDPNPGDQPLDIAQYKFAQTMMEKLTDPDKTSYDKFDTAAPTLDQRSVILELEKEPVTLIIENASNVTVDAFLGRDRSFLGQGIAINAMLPFVQIPPQTMKIIALPDGAPASVTVVPEAASTGVVRVWLTTIEFDPGIYAVAAAPGVNATQSTTNTAVAPNAANVVVKPAPGRLFGVTVTAAGSVGPLIVTDGPAGTTIFEQATAGPVGYFPIAGGNVFNTSLVVAGQGTNPAIVLHFA